MENALVSEQQDAGLQLALLLHTYFHSDANSAWGFRTPCEEEESGSLTFWIQVWKNQAIRARLEGTTTCRGICQEPQSPRR